MWIRLCIIAGFSYMAGMDMPPRLTDRAALQRNRARPDAMFLQATAAADVPARLIEVNRTFTAPAVVAAFQTAWA